MINSYGLTKEQFKKLQQNLIEPLKQKKARVFIFGSRANGTFKKFSDIDLFYIPAENNPITDSFTYQLLSSIEDSNFPFKIDLMNYDHIAVSYKPSVDRDKIEL